jgi:hypothetical protein
LKYEEVLDPKGFIYWFIAAGMEPLFELLLPKPQKKSEWREPAPLPKKNLLTKGFKFLLFGCNNVIFYFKYRKKEILTV